MLLLTLGGTVDCTFCSYKAKMCQIKRARRNKFWLPKFKFEFKFKFRFKFKFNVRMWKMKRAEPKKVWPPKSRWLRSLSQQPHSLSQTTAAT